MRVTGNDSCGWRVEGRLTFSLKVDMFVDKVQVPLDYLNTSCFERLKLAVVGTGAMVEWGARLGRLGRCS